MPSLRLPTLAVTPAPTVPNSNVPSPGVGAPHIMVIVMENREYSEVVGSASAPYINSLRRQYGSASDAYATTHPSLPNYLELIAGTTFGITSDCTGCSVEATTLVDQLSSRGIEWRAYMEGMPSPCYTGAGGGDGYAKKHDPFVYVNHIRDTPAACGRVVPYDRLATDLGSATPPSFIWVTPNLCDDGHDCSTSTADAWLARVLPTVLTSQWYASGGAIIVTWDEGGSSAGCCGSARGGHIPTVIVSPKAVGGHEHQAAVDQAGILATIESEYGVARLGDAACPCSGDLLDLV
ncbi:MAG TPA: alkaline phosphatase family protein [Candidatus Sulfotelmatobacter sp.]|nr:alkaline phosphatase family protein [Candidatus Sulfotelmatobacter sp.]